MKKFLPAIIFVMVFLFTLGGSIVYKMLSKGGANIQKTAETQNYENLFLHGSYEDLNGKRIEMTKIAAPVVIYNFWASWCNPCLEEIPSLLELKKKFSPEELEVIAINTDEDNQKENIEKIVKKMNIGPELTIVPDKDARLVSDFKVQAIPVTIIFHRGEVVYVSNGPMDFNSEEMVENMKKWVRN